MILVALLELDAVELAFSPAYSIIKVSFPSSNGRDVGAATGGTDAVGAGGLGTVGALVHCSGGHVWSLHTEQIMLASNVDMRRRPRQAYRKTRMQRNCLCHIRANCRPCSSRHCRCWSHSRRPPGDCSSVCAWLSLHDPKGIPVGIIVRKECICLDSP